MRIWANLEHDNVLPLQVLGYFTEGEKLMPALIPEWMEKGTLPRLHEDISALWYRRLQDGSVLLSVPLRLFHLLCAIKFVTSL